MLSCFVETMDEDGQSRYVIVMNNFERRRRAGQLSIVFAFIQHLNGCRLSFLL